MRPNAVITGAAQIILIAVLAGIGDYAFLSSGAYETARNYGIMHKIAFIPYLPLIIWSVLTCFGVLNIILANRSSGSFIWLITIFSLPSLLAHNTVDWVKIFGGNFQLTTGLSFSGMLLLGALTVAGYIILNYLRQLKAVEHSMTERRFDPVDIESITGFSTMALFTVITCALAATALAGSLSFVIEKATLSMMRRLPWNIVFIGVFCLLLIAFYLYWFFAHRRKV